MTTTPHEPAQDSQVAPSGDPGIPPGEDPGVTEEPDDLPGDPETDPTTH